MMTRELAEEFKKVCEEQDCEECPFSVGIYMEGLDYVYYSCDIRKKPREWDIAKVRMKQSKGNKTGEPQKEKKKKTSRKKKEKTAEEKPVEKKKRSRKKKEKEA